MSNQKTLQLLRNATLSENRESAIEAIKNVTALKDGQILINRYGDGSKCIVGIAYVDDNAPEKNKMFLIDTEATPENVQNALDGLKNRLNNITGITTDNYVGNNTTNYLKNAASLKDADEKLDKALKGVSDRVSKSIVNIEQVTNEEQYTKADSDKYRMSMDDKTTKDFQLTFTPLSPSTLTMPATMGDLTQGTTAESLRNMPLSEILDKILFKTVYPAITDPSGSINFKNSFTTNSIVEVGAAAPQDANMGYTFNKGIVKVDDGRTPDSPYVGEATGATYTYTYKPGAADTNAGVIIGGTAENNVSLKEGKLSLGTYTYSGTIAYGAGKPFKDSKGNTTNPMQTTNKGKVANPHLAGNLNASNILTINVSAPVYIDKNANGKFTKEDLQKWGSMKFTGITLSGTSAAAPLQIKTPRKLKTVNSYNKVSGKYDTPQLSNFTITNSAVQETINGVTVNYFLYKWTGGSLGGGNYEIITY